MWRILTSICNIPCAKGCHFRLTALSEPLQLLPAPSQPTGLASCLPRVWPHPRHYPLSVECLLMWCVPYWTLSDFIKLQDESKISEQSLKGSTDLTPALQMHSVVPRSPFPKGPHSSYRRTFATLLPLLAGLFLTLHFLREVLFSSMKGAEPSNVNWNIVRNGKPLCETSIFICLK